MTNLTDDLTITRPDWMPDLKELTVNDDRTRFVSAHFDSPTGIEVDVSSIGVRDIQVLRVRQTTTAGIEEDIRLFFNTKDVNSQLNLADALEDVAESLRDQASATLATFLAEFRREEQLQAEYERANDASGFDSGRAA